MISFEDRVSAYPGRYLLTAEDGSTSYVVLERADEPLVAGTPLNAENLNSVVENIFPGTESPTYRGCYFRTVDGETEWLNPPMAGLIEYRTVERYNNLPVYVKRVILSTTSNEDDGGDMTNDGPPVGSKIISLSAVIRYMDGSKETTESLPGATGAYVNVQPFLASMFPGDYSNMDVILYNAPANATAEVKIKYVKE